jgi:hypothetical protein
MTLNPTTNYGNTMIDLTKKYRTRNGWEVRIYATDGGGKLPVHGAVLCDGEWQTTRWALCGTFSASGDYKSDLDLIELKPRIKRTYWINIYPQNAASIHPAPDFATICGGANRIACVKIEIDCEEGEGL